MKTYVFSKLKFEISTPSKLEIFFGLFFLISLLVKCLYFQFTTDLIEKPFNKLMVIASIGMLFIISSFIFMFFKKYRCVALFFLDVVLTIFLISDTIYFRYYSNAITVPVLLQIGLIGPLGESIRTLINIKDLTFLFDFPILIAGIILIWKKGFNIVTFKRRLIISVIGMVSGLMMFISVYSNTNKLWFDYDKNYVAKQLGIMYFHFFDVKSYINENILVSRSLSGDEKVQVENYFHGKSTTGSNFKGIAKDKNVIIVQLEAIQQFLIGRKINGIEITPNMNKLVKESLYFDNFYYQVGAGNTSDAELLCNASLYPAKEGAAYFRYSTNTFNSLPKLLKQQGYNSYSFHAYHPSFWNRTVMHKELGFDRFFSEKDYIPGETIGFGLNDTSFLTQSLDKPDKSKPFYSFMITLSSHFAYAPFEYYSFDVGKYEHTEMGDYLKAANYVDKSIGEFIDGLKKKGLYDNTVLVFYGDHFMIPKGQADELLEYLGLDNNDFEWTKNGKVPCIIHYPGLKNGTIDHVTGGEIDLLPTVANLLGINAPYAMGKDLLNTTYGYAVLRNGSVVTDNYVYVSDTQNIYDYKTGKILDKSKFESEIKRYQSQLDISDIILKKDAFKTIK